MRFKLVQQFSGTVTDVEAAFLDPAVLQRVAAGSLVGRPELLEQVDDGDTVRQRVRYAFTGHLPPAARAVVDPARLSWVEESVLDRRTHQSPFEILPDHYPDRLECQGTVTLEEAGGVTRRVTTGDLRVRVLFVARRVEQAIVSGLRDHAAAEQEVVQRWLDERGEKGN